MALVPTLLELFTFSYNVTTYSEAITFKSRLKVFWEAFLFLPIIYMNNNKQGILSKKTPVYESYM